MAEISRVALFGKLNSLAYRAIEAATVFCKLRGNPYVELVHWVHQILELQDSDLHRILRHFETNPGTLARDLTAGLDRLPRGATSISDLSAHVEEATELLRVVGMAEQAWRPCGILAYGDLKRVELAVALANEPKLLLMDEPTAGMASHERAALMALTAEIVRERRIGVLFTEHDMDVVFGHADRVIVLDRGRVIAVGPPAAVRNDPAVRDVYLGAAAVA